MLETVISQPWWVYAVMAIVLVAINLGDHYGLYESDYGWCRTWWHYPVQYLTNVFIGCFTQPINSLTAGHPNDTYSARTGRNVLALLTDLYISGYRVTTFGLSRCLLLLWWGSMCLLIGILFFGAHCDLHHCRRAAEREAIRR